MNAKQKSDEDRYTHFIQDLAELSKKHGVILSITGNVYLVPTGSKKLKTLRYTNDYTSGDIHMIGFFD